MVTFLTRLVAIIGLYVGEGLAQTSPLPGPTVPPKALPVSKNLVVNPTRGECNARSRRDLRLTRGEFDRACARVELSR
jgi:hypothetical protein